MNFCQDQIKTATFRLKTGMTFFLYVLLRKKNLISIIGYGVVSKYYANYLEFL